MEILIRIYVPNGDKANIELSNSTLERALEILEEKESNIIQRVIWANFEDIYFHNTKNYIRIIN